MSQRIIDRCTNILSSLGNTYGLVSPVVISPYCSGISDLPIVDDIGSSIKYYYKAYQGGGITKDFKIFVHPYYDSEVYVVRLKPNLYESKIFTFDGYNVEHPQQESILSSMIDIHSQYSWTKYNSVYIATQFKPSYLFGPNSIHLDYINNISISSDKYSICEINRNTIFYDDFENLIHYGKYSNYLSDKNILSEKELRLNYDIREIVSYDNYLYAHQGFKRSPGDLDFDAYLFNSINRDIIAKPLHCICKLYNDDSLEYTHELLASYRDVISREEPYVELSVATNEDLVNSIRICKNFLTGAISALTGIQGIIIRPTVLPPTSIGTIQAGFRIRTDDYICLTNGFDYREYKRDMSVNSQRLKICTLQDISYMLAMLNNNRHISEYKTKISDLLKNYQFKIFELGNFYKI